MYKKLSLALTFISFLVLVSCTANGKNTWKNITSIDEILGEWEGIMYFHLSTAPDSPELEMPVKISVTTGNKQNYLFEIINDFSQILDFYIDGGSDLTKDELWEVIISSYNNSKVSGGTFFEKYSARRIITIPFEEKDTFDLNSYQINQRGDRLKLLLGDTMFESMVGKEEIILQRRKNGV